MNFWQIKCPEYDTGFKSDRINGSLIHPFGLPGVECDICGETWGGIRILPSTCPIKFRRHKNIVDGWPISRQKHEALQRELMSALSIKGDPFITLKPGNDFQPCFLDVSTRPRADFLWASLGSLVVSERIKDVLVENWQKDVVHCPVTLRKIGNREAKLPPPISELEDSKMGTKMVPTLQGNSTIPSYFEILIQKESKFPPGGTPAKICRGCARPSVNNATREIRMTQEMWNGDNIFFLATTLYVVVTDEVRTQLLRHHPTNVFFEKI